MKTILILLSALILSSCTTLSKKDCETQNWQSLGQKDALAGKGADAFAKYVKTCKQFGFAPNEEAYIDGRTKGLVRYCTIENGQEVGSRGEAYESICPQNLESQFLRGYNVGKREYDLKKREEEIQKREESLRAASTVKRDQCTFDSDCKSAGHCSFSKCDGSGKKCSFDSDCGIQLRCSIGTECSNGSCDTFRMCK